MRILASMAVALTVVYMLSGFISRHFSELATSIIDLFLFVTVMVLINSMLRSLKGD